MRKFILLTFFGLCSCKGFSQITKKNWLVGGTGRISFQNENLDGTKSRSTVLNLSPDVGYFFADKSAAGMKLGYGYSKIKTGSYTSSTNNFSFGPFARYYFLSTDNRINAFAQGAYQFSIATKNFNSNTTTLSAGAVAFFNKSVGIELTANYEFYNVLSTVTNTKTFFIALGFQIHLEKDDK